MGEGYLRAAAAAALFALDSYLPTIGGSRVESWLVTVFFSLFSVVVAGNACCGLGCLSSPYYVMFTFPIDWLSRFRTAKLTFLVLQLGSQCRMYIEKLDGF